MEKIDLKKVNANQRKPDPNMSPEEWQTYFRALRMMVEPSKLKKLPRKENYASEGQVYYGETLWQQYCKFINDVLRFIRSGEEDFCFFIYQIAELLRFEHDRLRTEWIPRLGCFRVWLEQ